MPEPWGGHRNGRIPLDALRVIAHATNAKGRVVTHLRLRTDASQALDRLLLMAPANLRYITDGYRDYDTQVALKAEKGRYAATPGTSNHGWAMAADCAYADPAGFARWLWDHTTIARQHGWYPPAWTHDRRGIEEPWHWEYDHRIDSHHGVEPGATTEEAEVQLKEIMKFAQGTGPVYLLNIEDGSREGIESHPARLGIAKLFGLDQAVNPVDQAVIDQFRDRL